MHSLIPHSTHKCWWIGHRNDPKANLSHCLVQDQTLNKQYINKHIVITYKQISWKHAPIFIKWWVGKSNVVPYNGIAFGTKKGMVNCHSAINMVESWKHAKWRDQSRKPPCRVITFMGSIQNGQICRDRQQVRGCQGETGWGKWGVTTKEYGVSTGDDKMF